MSLNVCLLFIVFLIEVSREYLKLHRLISKPILIGWNGHEKTRKIWIKSDFDLL